VPLVLILALRRSSNGGSAGTYVDLGILALGLIGGVVSWLVTRWRLDPSTLFIETGLLRRRSRRLPLARVQAVDIVEPFFAKVFGLAELRVRLAGSSRIDGRLSYLREPEAVQLRTELLSGQRASEPEYQPPAAAQLAAVPSGRLIASIFLGGPGAMLGFVLIVLIALAAKGPTAIAGSLVGWLFVVGLNLWRRVRAEYGFKVAHVADGLQLKSGLLQTVTETIPRSRIQALRRVEPLIWRRLGWGRLEVSVASGQSSGSGDGQSRRVSRTLLPVGTDAEVSELLHAVLVEELPALVRPPRRSAFRAPLQYHFLRAGFDRNYVVGVTGRVCRRTTIVPIEKVQSIRTVRGPLERWLHLTSVFVDAAGRRTSVRMTSRDELEALQILEELASLSRAARVNALHTGMRDVDPRVSLEPRS
jgi:putative membrane protein